MAWHTKAVGPDTFLIMHGDEIAGSIVLLDEEWRVEVLWSGPGGNITADFLDYTCALSFLQGVEAMFDRTRAR